MKLMRAPRALLLSFLLFGSVLAGMAIGALDGIAASVAMLAAAAFLVFATAAYWRALDEAAREAHKWAWYWGGSVGLGFAGAFMAVARSLEGVDWRDLVSAPTDGALVAFGVLICMLLQIVGYGVAWAYWWLSRR